MGFVFRDDLFDRSHVHTVTGTHTYRQTVIHSDRQTVIQTDRQTDRQTVTLVGRGLPSSYASGYAVMTARLWFRDLTI